MKKVNLTIISASILAFLLLLMILYSKDFERILNTMFSTKFPSGSRIPLHELFLQHLEMVAVSSLIAIAAGLALGIFVTTRYGGEFKEPLLKLVNFGQSFPSAALLALVIPIVGYGIEGALIALTIYSLMPIVYNVVTGIEEVPKDVLEAAKGMGMTERETYIKVKIPLALNAILGGIRTAVVINISAATLAATAGAGGLGVLVVNGVKTFDMILILEGSIPVTLFAIIAELVLKDMQKRVVFTR